MERTHARTHALFHESDTMDRRIRHGMAWPTYLFGTYTIRPIRFLFRPTDTFLAGWGLLVVSRRGVVGRGGSNNRNVEEGVEGRWLLGIRIAASRNEGAFLLHYLVAGKQVWREPGWPFCICRRRDGMNGTIWSWQFKLSIGMWLAVWHSSPEQLAGYERRSLHSRAEFDV